jgi:addiction module HigA family antidote
MAKKFIGPIHPGEHIREDFLHPLGLSIYRFAKHMGISQAHASELVKGKRHVTPLIALKLGKLFGTSAELWLGLQMEYEMDRLRGKAASITKGIKPIPSAVWKRAEDRAGA